MWLSVACVFILLGGSLHKLWNARQWNDGKRTGSRKKGRLCAVLCIGLSLSLGACNSDPVEQTVYEMEQTTYGGEYLESEGIDTKEPDGEDSDNMSVENLQAETSQADNRQESTPKEEAGETEEVVDTSFDFTIDFAGDINFDANVSVTKHMDTKENGILDCISPELVEEMNRADLMCLNNEFTYSERGEKLVGKKYCFRARPDRVENLKLLGVDIVKLANNHVYDYGKDAFLDTLEVLKGADIAYMGAGENLEEATTPVYREIQGKTVAFVAASRGEKNIFTPQATEDSPGILRCYDPSFFLEVIKEARENADIVLAYVHWGTEYSTVLEEAQIETAKLYLDAGADAIIGAHTHCLQGLEYYDGKPIFYSLGNFWFNNKTLDTMLLQLHFIGDDDGFQIVPKIFPAVQSGCETILAEGEERERIFQALEEISIGVQIDEEGIVYPVEAGVE